MPASGYYAKNFSPGPGLSTGRVGSGDGHFYIFSGYDLAVRV